MNTNKMIESYYTKIQNKNVSFNLSAGMVLNTIIGRKHEQDLFIEKNRYILKFFNILGKKTKHYQAAYNTAERFYLLYQVLGSLVEKGVPCYIFGRPDSVETDYYSELAQERINNHLDFPVMSEDYNKYKKHFSEILKEKNSEEYVKELKKIPQVIKRGYLYGHDDTQSEHINIINGRRVVVDAVAGEEKTIHVYGRCGVFGYAVSDSENIPSLLQKKFNKSSGNTLKVVNQGLWGAGDDLIINNLVVNANTYGKKDIIVLYIKPPQKKELEHLQKKGIYYYDCTKTFHDDEKSHYCFYDRAGHMSAEGYDVMSSFIHDKLSETEYKCGNFSSDTLQLDHDYVSKFLKEKTSGEFQKNLTKYLEKIKADYPLRSDEKKIGSIVMNCNPFTLGHYYLIEYASKKVDRLYIFILQEDKSFFKFNDRIELVRKGTKDLKNVIVIPSGEFMISALTFPEYFMKDYKKSIDFDATKDLNTFGNYISPALNISIRFAGEEPIDVVTREYNRSMERLLPEMGVEFHEIPRKTVDGKQVVSASKVRALMKENKWNEIKDYVPESTYKHLIEKHKK